MNTRSDRGIVFDVQRFCLHDGPGIRTTVFFKGCPLRCAWCHNPESARMSPELSFHPVSCIGCGECAAVCPSGAITAEGFLREKCVSCFACAGRCPTGSRSVIGYETDAETLLQTVLRDLPFYRESGGLTVSGGEPFAQSEFLLALLSAAKEAGLHTAVETSGAAKADDLLRALPVTDLFLFDCKGAPGEVHKKYVGCDGHALHENLLLLDAHGAKTVLRCPIIPGVHDNTEHFAYLTSLAGKLQGLTEVDIEPYHTTGLSKADDIGKTDMLTVAGYDKNAFKARIREEFLPLLADIRVPVVFY